jgi:hypothetical protein
MGFPCLDSTSSVAVFVSDVLAWRSDNCLDKCGENAQHFSAQHNNISNNMHCLVSVCATV